MIMKIVLSTAIACGLLTPAIAQDAPRSEPDLAFEQRAALQCSAAFAIVANAQEAGDTTIGDYPVMNERGREFFVQVAARLMDERGLTRGQIATIMQATVQNMVRDDTIQLVMPGCLEMLDNSGI